ncbi:MAG: AGE family epimerase/isomerase, partial [Anaerolineales bacterium]|nr:AGE family epimerase/isomerase [Anaerolineales bacterium]
PFQTHKLVYGQAFGIYGLAEYYLATGEQESLETAVSLYQLLEQHSTDKEYNGYWEAHERDWRLRADNVDEIAEPMSKTMNTHLHLIEAYTNLLRAWPDAGLKARLRNLIDIAIKHIINPETHHFWLHFKRTWQPLHQDVSYGHDIEGSWLLLEAVELLDEPALHHQVAAIARRMAQATYNEGLNPDGSLREGRDDDRIWWVQAEAMVGFLNAYQMTGSQHFWDASWQCWQYTKQAISDPQYGEWLWGRSSDGQPLPHEKAGPWKTAYHNGRACLEIMHRLHAA